LNFRKLNKEEKDSIEEKISKLMHQCNLGQIIENPIRVNGGLSHRMYKVVTNQGIYAVKELNKGIMKREEAYSNFVFSEKVTDIAKENGISAIGAIKINDDIMVKIEDTYFMIFNWLDGIVLKPNKITEFHCEKIGKVLAQIHNIDFSKLDSSKKIEDLTIFNWQVYIEKANEKRKKYAELLEINKALLEELNEKSIIAMKYANQNLIISHRDLDRKNVMWKDEIPYIIDWEASGYINPIIEVISTAYYWCGGEIEELDIMKFETFLSNYKSISKININYNVETLVYADFYSTLNWLEYNLKRALNIYNNYDQSEIELAENEIIKSMNDIKYNLSQIDTIIKIMKK
jgi:Ser/Thr protein kinase RdoA (MazF antagonist)